MPYISQELRTELRHSPPRNVGGLTYLLTLICKEYWQAVHPADRNFNRHSQITSALDHARHEWFRRMVAPYEDEKMVENGDVYPPKGE